LDVRTRIDSAATSVGRHPESIRLLVVTKLHPIETINAAIEAGIREFGENYVEEAVEKIVQIGSGKDLIWHMIGHIQSRKAEQVTCHFDLVHSLDSIKLAIRLDRFAGDYKHVLPVLLECNVSGEESKFGFPVFEKSQLENFITDARKIASLPHLEIHGLMTMPPLYEDAEKTRPYFRKLRELRDILRLEIPENNWFELSMGTSADFPAAVEEGSTMVRVGTAILGSRTPKNRMAEFN